MAELTYTQVGDYLIPDLMMDSEDEAEERPLGKYGMLRETFLKEHHHGTYTSMLLTGRLESRTCGRSTGRPRSRWTGW